MKNLNVGQRLLILVAFGVAALVQMAKTALPAAA